MLGYFYFFFPFLCTDREGGKWGGRWVCSVSVGKCALIWDLGGRSC